MTQVVTRYAIFDGRLRPGSEAAFRRAVLEEVVPRWQRLPGALAVRIAFADSRDPDAPEYPAILAIDYPDRAALSRALMSAEREACREALEGRVLPLYFTGRLHHHVTATRAAATTGQGGDQRGGD